MNVFTTDHPMMSEPSGRMKTSTMVFTALALSSFVVAGLVWLLALRNERMATPVLERPIRFVEGFAFTNTFTVYFGGVYWVEVVCPRTNSTHFNPEQIFTNLSNQLPVKFTIMCDGKVITEGDSTNRGSSGSAKEDARHMATFRGESGKNYELSFRNESAVPAIDASNPTLRIRLSQRLSIKNILLHLCSLSLARDVGVLGLIFALSPCGFFVRRVFQRNV